MAEIVRYVWKSSCIGREVGVKSIMQFSKFMPLVCAAAFCAGLICARAEDTPAQAAARAALEQKMSDLDAQEAATNAAAMAGNPSSPAMAQPSQPATSPAVVIPPSVGTQEQPGQPAAVTVTPAPVESQTPSDIAAQAATRAALDEKMRQLDAQQAATNAASATVVATTPSVTVPVQAPVAATPPQVTANYPGKELGLKPIDVPPPPVSAEKEAQLQALLAKYMADQVSPEEYQQQRAAILAAP
jgi:hypothetical protein